MSWYQYIQLGCHRSPVLWSSSVPQGGVLSALLIIAYVAPVGDVISSCGMEYHQFVYGTQLFIAVRAKMIHSLCGRYLHYCRQTVVRYNWTSAERRQVRSHFLWFLCSAQIDFLSECRNCNWFISTCHKWNEVVMHNPRQHTLCWQPRHCRLQSL